MVPPAAAYVTTSMILKDHDSTAAAFWPQLGTPSVL